MVIIQEKEALSAIRKSLARRGKVGPQNNTVKAYTTDIRMLFRETQLLEIDLAKLDDIASEWLNECRDPSRPKPLAAKTIARRITSVRFLGSCYGLTVLKYYEPPAPAEYIPHPLPGLESDLLRMLETAAYSSMIQCLIALCGLCGLRISEARSLKVSDIDIQRMMITVRGKGDRFRDVPISPNAWKYMCIRVVMSSTEPQGLLVTIPDRQAREAITIAGQRARISRRVSSHDLRATFATCAYNVSKSTAHVQRLLGHRTQQQTMLYIGTTLEDLRSAASFDLGELFTDEENSDE